MPWFEDENGQIFVLAKKDFPRPIVNSQRQNNHLNRANYSGYLTEPISAIIHHRDTEIQREIEKILLDRAKLQSDEILKISEPNFYFPSAGGIDERVESHLVRISAWGKPPQVIENYTPFVNAGVVRELDALQILRASHVGGMFDARLEINIYRLLRSLKRSNGAWIGAEIKPTSQSLDLKIETEINLETRQVFEPCELEKKRFLKLERSEFIEYDCTGDHLKRAEFEYVSPNNFSKNTVVAIPFFMANNEFFVGVEYRDLPAVQRFTGNSQLVCVPAWRLSKTVSHKFDIQSFLYEKFTIDFNVAVNKLWELGGSYFTSAGITPEVVYPFAVELNAEKISETDIKFFSFKDLLAKIDEIQDAHLLILLNRLAHALGLSAGK